jgi:hypothetical protein
VTNAYYFIGAPDVILGPIANFVAALLVMVLRKHRLLACISGALPIGFIVGSYLWLYFPPPSVFGVLSAWAAMVVSITISSLIAVGVIGYIVLSFLSSPRVIGPLRARGLKILTDT